MRRVLVKICGITERRDAVEAALLGVDAVGFHFWEASSRRLSPAAARGIVERLPALLTKVGVFVDEEPGRILEIVREVGLTAVQLNGEEPPEACAALSPVAWYKVLRAGPRFRADSLGRYSCNTYLIDTWRPHPGSERFEWGRVRGLSLYGRILIAGGLDPSNVEAAIEQALPWGVDVASGVEAAPGIKDLDRVEAFVRAVRRSEARNGIALAGGGAS